MVSLLGALLQNESGGRNILQGNIGDINNRTGDLAKGYFQITDATWRDFGGLNTGYTRAIDAPYEVQAQVAANIPLKRWGPNTIKAMQATGKPIDLSQTLGQNLAAHGESFGSAPNVGGHAASVASPQAAIDAAHPGQQPMGGTALPAPGTPGGAMGPANPPGWTGPAAAPTMVADEKKGWREKLGKAIAGYKAPAMAKNDTALASMAMPKAMTSQAPAVSTLDPNKIAEQRQQLAQAMQRLNSGNLWL